MRTADRVRRSKFPPPLATGLRSEARDQARAPCRIELFSRLFVDIDALGFFGFRPSAHVGVDLFAGDVSAVVPVLGLGLRRESF